MIFLPKDKEALSYAIRSLVHRGDVMRRTRIPEWIVNQAYLNGVRDFTSVDYTTGQVNYKYTNAFGKLRFKNETILRDLQIEMGRLLGIDIRPSIKMLGWGLDRLRASSIGQVIVDHAIPEAVLSKVRAPFFESLLIHGCCGVMASVDKAGFLSGRTMLEIVPAWEIIPLPSARMTPEQVPGIIRTRLVPLEWIKRSPLGDKIKRVPEEDLMIQNVNWAGMTDSTPLSGSDVTASVVGMMGEGFQTAVNNIYGSDGSDGKDAGKYDEGRKFVRLIEGWLTTQEGLVRRYFAMVGKAIIADEDFEESGESVYKPLGVARYYNVGFYGRSFVGPLIPISDEIERATESLFQQIREWDSLGILTLPTSLGINDRSFKVDGRPKKVYYTPDPLDANIGVGQITPHSVGTLPQQVINLGQGIKDKIAGQSELFMGGAPGRADSAASFGFLLETANVGIEAAGNSIADCFGTVYSAVLGSAKFRMTPQDMIKVTTLDSMAVGVVVGESGGFSLTANPIPEPSEVKVNVKSRTPPSPTQRINQLTQMLQLQIIDPVQFRLTVYREGLELPVGNEQEYQTWRKCRLMIRSLFNDGKTPGAISSGDGGSMPVAVDTENDDIGIHLMELGAFMASPEYSMADKAVKDAFNAWKRQLKGMTGTWPGELPTPDMMDQSQGGMPTGPEVM